MNCSKEVIGSLVVPGSDTPEVLQSQNMRSTALRARYRNGLKQPFHRRFALNGMLGTAPRLSMKRRMALASYALSAMTMAPSLKVFQVARGACGASAAFPPVSRKAIGLPAPSLSAWILVFRPPRLTPMAWANAPLFRQRRSDALSRAYCRAGPPLEGPPAQDTNALQERWQGPDSGNDWEVRPCFRDAAIAISRDNDLKASGFA